MDAEHAAITAAGASGVGAYVCCAVRIDWDALGSVERPSGLGVVWLAGMILNRWLQAGAILRVLGDPDWLRGMLLYPLRDLLGSVLWLGSYGGDRFYYRGKIYRLQAWRSRGGAAIRTTPEFKPELVGRKLGVKSIRPRAELHRQVRKVEVLAFDSVENLLGIGYISVRLEAVDVCSALGLLLIRTVRPDDFERLSGDGFLVEP